MASARAGRGPRRRGSSGAGEPGAGHQTALLGRRRGCEWHAGRSRYFRTRVRGTRGLRRVDFAGQGETMDLNKVIQRARSLLVSPRTEWPVIAAEPATIADLYREYIMIVAAIPAVCGFVKVSLLGYAWHGFRVVYRRSIGAGLTAAIVEY